MVTLSLCMIVKNEERYLDACLASIHDIVDEIIIVDTGSTDRTKEIAYKYTDKIYDFEWVYDFSAARNYSFSLATMDYIMWLDADDVILEEDRQKLIDLKNNLDPSTATVMMTYNYTYDDDGNLTLALGRERWTKRAIEARWHEPIHEYLERIDPEYTADICITHRKRHINSDRNLAIFEKMIENDCPFTTRSHFYYACDLFCFARYDEAIEHYKVVMDTEDCWVEDYIKACYYLAECYFRTNRLNSMLSIALKSFEYDKPRPEACCHIGLFYFLSEQYDTAIFWYDLATKTILPPKHIGFSFPEAYCYVPYVQQCICYYNLGDYEKGKLNNEKALSYDSTDSKMIHYRHLLSNYISLSK